jgi:hypothetical protein
LTPVSARPLTALFAFCIGFTAVGLAACTGGSELAAIETESSDTAVDDTDDVSDDTREPDAGDTVLPLDTGTPPTGAVTVQTLLTDETVTLTAGESTAVSVEVPADTVSLTWTISGVEGTQYAIAEWTAGNEVLVTPNWLETSGGICTTCRNRVAPNEGVGASMTPNNPAAVSEVDCGGEACLVHPGMHTVKALGLVVEGFSSSPATGDVTLQAYAKVVPGGRLPATGVLDLNLHFTGSKGWTAATAPTDPEFQAMLADVGSTYAQVGITLGELSYRDVDSGFAVIESLMGAGSDLNALFAASEGNTLNALNLFFVDELVSPFGGIILGVAGGIPGPPLQQGTSRSGVAISTADFDGAPSSIATTTAHEAGHFLGLFHTSEQTFGGFIPAVHDPLPDTPEEPDAGFDQNVMFNTGSGSVLSPWQGRVMRSSAWVRHPEEQ